MTAANAPEPTSTSAVLQDDATELDHLAEQTNNGPDPDMPAPSQDPMWDPNAGVDAEVQL